MTLVLTRPALTERRALASGPLASLADSLAVDLDRLLPPEAVTMPVEKAKLTRKGGRCERDGTLLEFDPREPRRHRCPQCGTVFSGEEHYRWWIMGYQLWLAERAIHAAALWALRGNPSHRDVAERILAVAAERYLTYPNADNVLGPTRPFFSTYLESIWLLQLAIALDTIELVDGPDTLGERVRERVIEPSARLIATYNEGESNRQVWNSAALAAAGTLLEDTALVDQSLYGRGGLTSHLEHGLLSDGTWYEGENYHLFAHRGLWYLVAMAESAGAVLPGSLRARFNEGFVTPFLTALPDLTFPARRDSQYGVSLRQWRVAESCELGSARRPADERLLSALGALYANDSATGDAARWRSTAEAERNIPGVRLTRADLGWKSVLFARAELPPLPAQVSSSALLEGQGFAVLRRDQGEIYAALDYGHAGGGHGHPDRLNFWFVHGTDRVLEDVGTGSYVERTLHWYRSTLAHNAPLVGGRSQPSVDGSLLAWAEMGDLGWVDAHAAISPGVDARRSLIATPLYVVDRLEWSSARAVTLDLPWHADGEVDRDADWTPSEINGDDGLEGALAFIESAERMGPRSQITITGPRFRAWLLSDAPSEWWRCLAPGPPGHESQRFLLSRTRASSGGITGVWSWNMRIRSVTREGSRVVVELDDGSRHTHSRDGDNWRIETASAQGREVRVLGGARLRDEQKGDRTEPTVTSVDPHLGLPHLSRIPAAIGELTQWSTSGTPDAPRSFRLTREHYRRSEQTWSEAGAPEALVVLGASEDALYVEVSVRKAAYFFVPARPENALDNEHPDINSDGLQVYLLATGQRGESEHHAFLIVPLMPGTASSGGDADDGRVRVTERLREGGEVIVDGRWRPTGRGYQLLLRIPLTRFRATGAHTLQLDVIVNEISRERERRRGQLVLSGAPNEWVYLRGDRQDPERYLCFRM